jgi:hypothetical protein
MLLLIVGGDAAERARVATKHCWDMEGSVHVISESDGDDKEELGRAAFEFVKSQTGVCTVIALELLQTSAEFLRDPFVRLLAMGPAAGPDKRTSAADWAELPEYKFIATLKDADVLSSDVRTLAETIDLG